MHDQDRSTPKNAHTRSVHLVVPLVRSSGSRHSAKAFEKELMVIEGFPANVMPALVRCLDGFARHLFR